MKKLFSLCLVIALVVSSFGAINVLAEVTEGLVIEFSDYSSAAYTSQSTGIAMSNPGTVVAQNDAGISWKVSNVHKGTTPANSKAWTAGGNVYVYAGNASANAMVNMDMGDASLSEITQISFDVINPDSGRKRSVAALLVDGNEKAAYTFYIEGDSWWAGALSNAYTPFVRKYNNYAYNGGEINNNIVPQTPDNVKSTDGKNLTISGPYDAENGKFGYNFIKAHWDVFFNRTTNTVSWTVTLTPRSPESYSAYTWSDSFVDEGLSDMLDNARYPIAVGSHTNTMGYNNVKIYGNIPLITDKFSAPSTYTSSNKLSFASGNPQTIYEAPTHKWLTSGVIYGNGAKTWIDNNKLCINANNNSSYPLALMDLGEKKLEKITKLEFDVINPNANRQRAYVNVLVDSEQKKGYAFHMGGDSWWEDNNQYTTRIYTPFVRKMNNIAYNGSSIATDIIYDGDNKLTRDANNVTICGPYDPNNGKFGNNYSKAHWSVEFDEVASKVSWTVTVIPRDTSKATYTWSDSFVDMDLSNRIKNCKYPFAVGVSTNDMQFSNFKIYGEYHIDPIVYDDFSTYSTCGHYTSSNKLAYTNAYTAGNSPLLGGNWVLSAAHQSVKSGDAYAYFGSDGKLYARGSSNASLATVNYDLKGTKLKNITQITADVAPNGTAGGRPYINLFVNDDELSFYAFAIGACGSSTTWEDGSVGRTENGAIHSGVPYVIKYNMFSEGTDPTVPSSVTTGSNSLVKNNIISANYANIPNNYTNAHWEINIDENANKISWTVTMNYSDGSNVTWSDSFTDPKLSNMIQNAEYPVAFGAVKNEVSIDNVCIYGEKYDTGISIDASDVKAMINNSEYGLGNAEMAIAFYDDNGDVIKVEKLSSSNTASQTYALSGAANVKAFLFDGNAADGKLVDEFELNTSVDYVIPQPAFKVACVGDSLTQGNGANPATYAYPAVLQRMLGYKYEVKNFGVGGTAVTDFDTENRPQYISKDEYANSKNYQPDIVLLMLGANDVYEVTSAERAQSFYEKYKALVQSYKALDSKPEIYLAITPVDKWQSDNVGLFQREAIRKVASEENVYCIDMRKLITDKSLLKDSVHFTNKGYKVLAGEFYKALTQKVNNISFTDSKFAINPQITILGDAYLASYKDNSLLASLKANGPFVSGENTEIDISSLDAENADTVKAFFWNGELTPVSGISELVKNQVVISQNGDVSVIGRTNQSFADAVITAFDSDGNIVYVGKTITDYDSVYKFGFNCSDVSEVYVNGILLN